MALCPTCGTEMTPDMAFCPNCGTPAAAIFGQAAPAATAQAGVYGAQAAPPQATAAPQAAPAAQAATTQSDYASFYTAPVQGDYAAASPQAGAAQAYYTAAQAPAAAVSPTAATAQPTAYQSVDSSDVLNTKDHTAQFTAVDVSQNKVFALLAYLMSYFVWVLPVSLVGIVVSSLAGRQSPFAMFHVRQATKIVVAGVLILCVFLVGMVIASRVVGLLDNMEVDHTTLGLISNILYLVVSVPCGLGIIFLWVSNTISLVGACRGKAKEPFGVSALKFMR